MSVYIYLSIYLSIHLSIYLSIYPVSPSLKPRPSTQLHALFTYHFLPLPIFSIGQRCSNLAYIVPVAPGSALHYLHDSAWLCLPTPTLRRLYALLSVASAHNSRSVFLCALAPAPRCALQTFTSSPLHGERGVSGGQGVLRAPGCPLDSCGSQHASSQSQLALWETGAEIEGDRGKALNKYKLKSLFLRIISNPNTPSPPLSSSPPDLS